MYQKMANTMNMLSKGARRLLFSRTYTVFKENLWTPANVVRSPYRDVEIPNSTIPEHIWQNMEKWADKPAVVRVIFIFLLCGDVFGYTFPV